MVWAPETLVTVSLGGYRCGTAGVQPRDSVCFWLNQNVKFMALLIA